MNGWEGQRRGRTCTPKEPWPVIRLFLYQSDASLSWIFNLFLAKFTAIEQAQNRPILKHLCFVPSPSQGLSFFPRVVFPLSIFSTHRSLCFFSFFLLYNPIKMLSCPLHASDKTTPDKVTHGYLPSSRANRWPYSLKFPTSALSSRTHSPAALSCLCRSHQIPPGPL